jgi:hypothetical protein
MQMYPALATAGRRLHAEQTAIDRGIVAVDIALGAENSKRLT